MKLKNLFRLFKDKRGEIDFSGGGVAYSVHLSESVEKNIEDLVSKLKLIRYAHEIKIVQFRNGYAVYRNRFGAFDDIKYFIDSKDIDFCKSENERMPVFMLYFETKESKTKDRNSTIKKYNVERFPTNPYCPTVHSVEQIIFENKAQKLNAKSTLIGRIGEAFRRIGL